MLTGQAKNIIERVRLGFVATVTPGGRPAVSPKGTFVVLDDTTLAFGNIRSPGTVQNISHSPGVEVNFVDPFTRKGCRVRGDARIVRRDTGPFDQHIGDWVALWANLADRIESLILIDVSAVKPLSTPPYDDGATEAQMIEIYKAKYAEMYP